MSLPYNPRMPWHLRPATAADADAAVPLIYSSGPAAFDFVFSVPDRSSALDFLRHAFLDGAGEFGFRNHVVAEHDGAVGAVGAAWGHTSNLGFAFAAARQILACYGPLVAPGVILRGLRIESVIPPPSRGLHYLAHLGVQPAIRGQGGGGALIEHLLAKGRAQGRPVAALDVAATNPRAQSLYERLGFQVTRERVSHLTNAQATVSNHRRMELLLRDRRD